MIFEILEVVRNLGIFIIMILKYILDYNDIIFFDILMSKNILKPRYFKYFYFEIYVVL